MSQNDIQVGGNHYKKGGAFQHWDAIERFGHGYLEGYATKYLTRFREKGGVLDLEKSKHCIAKLKELYLEGVRLPRGYVPMPKVLEYLATNKIHHAVPEASALCFLFQWRTEEDLDAASQAIDKTIALYKMDLACHQGSNPGDL